MLKVGRYTASMLLISVGALLLLDQINHSNLLRYVLEWWPLILIALGCEYLIFNFMYSRSERQVRFDFGGLIAAVLISAIVVGTTQTVNLPSSWKNFRFNIETLQLSYSSEEGYSFDKARTQIPMGAETERVIIDNSNGSVELRTGQQDELEIQTTVWVDKVEKQEAQDIADHSGIRWEGSKVLQIQTDAKEYTGGFPNKRKPRMNIVVFVPAARQADYELELRNGKAMISQISIRSAVKVHTINGDIQLNGLQGDVDASSTNGNLQISSITGNSKLHTTNGAIQAVDVGGETDASTTNGTVTVERSGGAVDIDTTNGKITVLEPSASVKANAVNGTLTLSTHQVKGDYTLETMHGAVDVSIPSAADVEVKGSTSFSSVGTNLPLTVEGKKITGTLNAGTYKLKINTSSRIDVNKLDVSA